MSPKDYSLENDSLAYWVSIVKRALALGSDVCTGVPDLLPLACYEHDVMYMTHATPKGDPIGRTWADGLFYQRHVNRELSAVGLMYYHGIRVLGDNAWRHQMAFDFDSVEVQEAP